MNDIRVFKTTQVGRSSVRRRNYQNGGNPLAIAAASTILPMIAGPLINKALPVIGKLFSGSGKKKRGSGRRRR